MLCYISETLVNETKDLNSLLKLYQLRIDQLIKTNFIKPLKVS